MTQTETVKFVKYWENEVPVTITTQKNEVRFFPQHGKVQVYPIIKTGRGIGKGATINFDKFNEVEKAAFKENYAKIASTEIFETNKSYWDHEEPVKLDAESNELRFYLKHGKLQIFPKIKAGRGIGKGASINFDVPASQRKSLDQQMRQLLDFTDEVDFDDLTPVNNTVVEPVVESTQNVKEMDEFKQFQMFKSFCSKSEDDILDLVIEQIKMQELAYNFMLSTFEAYPAEEALAILNDELLEHVTDYSSDFLWAFKVVDNVIKANVVLDREFIFDAESVIFGCLDKYPIFYNHDEGEEIPAEDEQEDEVIEPVAEIDAEDDVTDFGDDEDVTDFGDDEDVTDFGDDEDVIDFGDDEETYSTALDSDDLPHGLEPVEPNKGTLQDTQKAFTEVAFAKDFDAEKAIEMFEKLKHLKLQSI